MSATISKLIIDRPLLLDSIRRQCLRIAEIEIEMARLMAKLDTALESAARRKQKNESQ